MPHKLDLEISAPFDVGDLMAEVRFESGTPQRIVLRQGRYTGSFADAPVRVRLLDEAAPAAESSPTSTTDEITGTPVEVHTLYEDGVAITPGAPTKVRLLWAAHCHDHDHGSPPQKEGRLFNSDEHMACGRFVGLSAANVDAKPLSVVGITARFRGDTPLPVGRAQLTFGEIICLAGDFFAHLDETAREAFASAWPPSGKFSEWLGGGDYRAQTLEDEEPRALEDILTVIRRGSPAGALGEYAALAYDTAVNGYPVRRYLALASQNHCHFANHYKTKAGDDDNEVLSLYLRYHRRALAEAASARGQNDRLLRALATDAFGCHFLTDAFASGHMRVPRRQLGERFGIVRGALKMSKDMHAEDNASGLWVTPRKASSPRMVWRAYGDGSLLASHAAAHLSQVCEAVRRSAAEVFTAFALNDATPRVAATALDLVPVPLAPGETPALSDVPPAGHSNPPASANPFPLFWLDSEGTVWRRTSPPTHNEYEREVKREKSAQPRSLVFAV